MNTVSSIHLLVVTLLLFPSTVIGNSLPCDDPNDEIADNCFRLYPQIENALKEDNGNIHRLRKAFFYAPNANPVLLKVVYNITFGENVTENHTNYCSSNINADNAISPEETVVVGWTSSGVYTVFHPLTINFMQIQIPFVLMHVMFKIFDQIEPNESGPEVETLLWDGSYELPKLDLKLHFTTLACTPSLELFELIISDFNSLIRIYAGNEITGIIQDSGNTRLVGFSLPSYQISPHDIRDGSDFSFYLLYVVSTIVLYATCVTAISFLASKTNTHGIKAFADKNHEIIKGVTVVTSLFIVLEISMEFIMSIIWAFNVKDGLIVFLVFLAGLLYYSPFIFSVGMIVYECRLYCNIKKLTKSKGSTLIANNYVHQDTDQQYSINNNIVPDREETSFTGESSTGYPKLTPNNGTVDRDENSGSSHDQKNTDISPQLTQDDANKNTSVSNGNKEPPSVRPSHVENNNDIENQSSNDKSEDQEKCNPFFKCFVWIMAYFAYIIMYAFFPAFILAFAYPTRIITIFVFLATFFVLSIVYVASFLKTGVRCTLRTTVRYNKKAMYVCVGFLLTVTLLYFFLFIFALLYSLVIGKASVVSSAPLAVLSLVPSSVLGLIIWIMKSTILKTDPEEIIEAEN